MQRKAFVLIGCSVLIFVTGATAFAQSAAFLSIPGIPGESQTVPGAIDLQSYTFSARAREGLQPPLFGDFNLTATVSKASPLLMLGVGTSHLYGSAVLSVRRTDGLQVEFVKYTLTNVRITSYQPQPADTLPSEQFTVAYGRIQFDYWIVNPDGSQGENTRTCWDISRG